MGHLFDPAGGEPVVADYLNSYGANETTTSRDLKTWQNGDTIFNTTLQEMQVYIGANGTSVPADWSSFVDSASATETTFAQVNSVHNKISTNLYFTYVVEETIDFSSVAANSVGSAVSVTSVERAEVGDIVEVFPLSELLAGLFVASAVVTSSGNVDIRLGNVTGGALDPSSTDFIIIVKRYKFHG